ncbi:hypothetical protein Ahy_B08g089594 [Arachis hypogaea]|uniref:BED-type domain-containing protein n=1 Tax=Arachis hypogaea TaxID=3818 RepID=A0A444XYB9_ARAHY|nr:hypothetical protein Ahy_B08g089594 [Arachis hypogaea]
MMNAKSESLIPSLFSLSLSQFSFTILIKVQREVENAITISHGHTGSPSRSHVRRAFTSVAQSPPSRNHFLRSVTTRCRSLKPEASRCLRALRESLRVPGMDDSINQELPRNNNAENNSTSNERSLPPASNKNQSQTSSVRGKSDTAWRYVALQNINRKPHYQCLFCLSTFGGGGINRMKKHLAKIGEDIKKCSKVPYDIEIQMECLLKEIQKSKTSKRKVSFNEEGTDECEDAIDEVNNLDSVEVMKEIHLYRDRKESFDRPKDIDADLDQGGGGSGGGGSTSTFYAAPLAFSGPSSRNEGDEINDENLQQFFWFNHGQIIYINDLQSIIYSR